MTHASRFPVAALLALALVGAACVDIVAAQYVDRQDKRFTVNGTPDVSLSTFDGSIEVRPWDRPEVLVTVEKHARDKADADAIEVHAEQNGNRIVVEVRRDKSRDFGVHIGWNQGRSARLIVQMPASATVALSSGDGSIDIERISGRFDLRSGDGSIHAQDLSGDVKAHTGDGSIKLLGVNGALDVDTGDGSVTIDGKVAELRARSGDGGVSVRAAPGSATAGDWTITTGDGSIALELPDGFNADLDAHAGDGSVHVEGITLSNVTGRIGRHSIRGQLGSGGRAVRVRTGDGSISVRRF